MDSVDNLAVVATYGSGTVLVQGNRIRAPELEPFVPHEGATETSERGENAPSDAANPAAVEAAQEAIGHETERQPTRHYENDASSQSVPGLGQSRSMHTSASASAPAANVPVGPAEALARTSYLPLNMGNNSFSSSSPRRAEPKRFLSIHPILCLSLHPHVYIPDYGVWGKEKYIENFWRSVDWQKADERYRAVKEIYGGNIRDQGMGDINSWL